MRLLLLIPAAAIAVVACASNADETAGTGSSDVVTADDSACTARLHFLQKDAYKEGAGRSSDFWPPHTTTVLDVTCGATTTTLSQSNHGTLPDAKDANGTPILVEEDVITATAPWSEMQKLLASYGSCECQPDAFLSLDEVNESAAAIVDQVASLFTCAEPTSALIDAAKAKNVADVKRILAGCSLRSDVTAADLEETTTEIEASVKSALGGKHVCNNDAALQADLFTHFRDQHEAPACDPHDATRCAFPKLFFRPAKEIK